VENSECNLLVEDYYNIKEVKELVIFIEWLYADNPLRDWAIFQLSNKKWKVTMDSNSIKEWFLLSK